MVGTINHRDLHPVSNYVLAKTSTAKQGRGWRPYSNYYLCRVGEAQRVAEGLQQTEPRLPLLIQRAVCWSLHRRASVNSSRCFGVELAFSDVDFPCLDLEQVGKLGR